MRKGVAVVSRVKVGAAIVAVALAGAALLYERASPEIDVASCHTCQEPKPPPSPAPVQYGEVVEVLAVYVDGVRLDPNRIGPSEVLGRRAPHPIKPGKCLVCHPPEDQCPPPCRSGT